MIKRIPNNIANKIPDSDQETINQIDLMLNKMNPLQRKIAKRLLRKMRKKYPDKEFPDVWTYSIHSIYILYKIMKDDPEVIYYSHVPSKKKLKVEVSFGGVIWFGELREQWE